jgi:hypothetical protein
MSDPRDDDGRMTDEWLNNYIRRMLDPRQPDPLRDCNYLLSLPRVCPGKAWRN